jgi:hypothetical protein
VLVGVETSSLSLYLGFVRVPPNWAKCRFSGPRNVLLLLQLFISQLADILLSIFQQPFLSHLLY